MPWRQPEGRRSDASSSSRYAGFGPCTDHGECEAACPKQISLELIARLNRDYFLASLRARDEKRGEGAG